MQTNDKKGTVDVEKNFQLPQILVLPMQHEDVHGKKSNYISFTLNGEKLIIPTGQKNYDDLKGFLQKHKAL